MVSFSSKKLRRKGLWRYKFTWFNSISTCKSRLDKILLSDQFIRKWNVVAQKVGDIDVSDHMPICLLSNNVDWGPKPFKKFDIWFDHPDFINFVKVSRDSIHVSYNASNILVAKLKGLREKLR